VWAAGGALLAREHDRDALRVERALRLNLPSGGRRRITRSMEARYAGDLSGIAPSSRATRGTSG
jgi:hypothetical protein